MVAVLLTVCEIFSRIEVENRRFRFSPTGFEIFALQTRSGGMLSNINVFYTLLKGTFSGLKFRRSQYGSIIIHLAVVAPPPNLRNRTKFRENLNL